MRRLLLREELARLSLGRDEVVMARRCGRFNPKALCPSSFPTTARNQPKMSALPS